MNKRERLCDQQLVTGEDAYSDSATSTSRGFFRELVQDRTPYEDSDEDPEEPASNHAKQDHAERRMMKERMLAPCRHEPLPGRPSRHRDQEDRPGNGYETQVATTIPGDPSGDPGQH